MAPLLSNKWFGCDLKPLPFESIVSSLWRFQWRNALRPSQVIEVCGSTKAYPCGGAVGKGFYGRLEWLQTERFEQATTWTVPSKEEREFAADLKRDTGTWCALRMRYCPLCLEQGYHSFWFQMPLLTACPLHGIPLSERCHSCDGKLPEYGFSKRLFKRAYTCPECGHPVSGAPPTLDARLEFQEREAEIFAVFNPYLLWWRQTREDRYRANELGTGAHAVYRHWCRTDDFLRSIVSCQTPIPAHFRPGGYPNIATLTWRLRLYDHGPVLFLSRSRLLRLCALLQDVYRGTLKILIKWISEHGQFTLQDHARHFWIQIDRHKIDVRNLRTDLLALCLMRHWLEDPLTYFHNGDISRATLKNNFPVSVPGVGIERHWVRLGWRAIFLATYATWYLRVLVAKRTGWLDTFDIGPDEFARATFETDGNGDRWAIGEVAFPTFYDCDALLSRYRKGLRYYRI